MPGIENLAPERTDTSSGFLTSPSLAPAAFSSLARFSIISRSTLAGIFRPSLVVERAGFGRDRETGRNRQPGVGHLGEARALAAEQVLHRAIAVGLAAAEEIDVLPLAGAWRPVRLAAPSFRRRLL